MLKEWLFLRGLISMLLGHTNIRTTQIYAKVSKKKLSRNMSELQKKLFQFDGSLVQLEPEVIRTIALHQAKMAS